MAGFNNDVVFAKNGDFTSATNTAPSESNGLATDGQLWIGTTAVNAGNTHINVGNLTSPNSSITFGYSSPNITAVVNPSVIQDLHTARYIVSAGGLPDGANYTTIASAIAAATGAGGNQTVFIQPGTYTENLTLVSGINLAAYDCDALTPNVIISGTCTFTAAGTVSISGIRLQTNSSFALAVTGSAASIVNLTNCFINALNNTAISFTSSSASASIFINKCNGNIATTGIALFAHSSAGTLRFFDSFILNSGNSTTASTVSAGNIFTNFCGFNNVFSLSNAANWDGSHSVINAAPINTACITTANTSVVNLDFTTFISGTASALSIGAGTTVTLNSSNANPITGAGTISYGFITFPNNSSINTTTQSGYISRTGITQSTLQPAFMALLSADAANVTGDGTTYTPIPNTEVFDQNANYNNATGTFTAPFTGRYQFSCGVGTAVLGAGHTQGQLWITTSNRIYICVDSNFAAMRDSGNILDLSFSALTDMDAADTTILQVTVSNSTKTVSVRGGATNALTYISGWLVC